MSEVLVLRSGPDLRSGFLKFPDLKNRLENDLDLVQTLPDLEVLIGSVNDLMKRAGVSLEEKNFLKRLRQRAYDRRRSFRPQVQEETTTQEETKPMFESVHETSSPSQQIASPVKLHTPKLPDFPSQSPNFWQGIQNRLQKIDGERAVEAFPGILAALFVMALVWLQSLEIYTSSSFKYPELVALGALAMIVGFAAYQAMARSFIAVLLCLYAGGYESYLMISGTVHTEKMAHAVANDENPEVVFIKEKIERLRTQYQEHKSRFEQPGSNVHSNAWFKKKYLDSSWQELEKAQKELADKIKDVSTQTNPSEVIWIKVLYRLGLVLLCMVLVHKLVARWKIL